MSTLLNFIKNKTIKLGTIGTKLFRMRKKSKSKSKLEVAPQDKSPSLSPKTKLVTQIQKSYKKKLKREKDIANFPKKRATRKIITAYRSAQANPNIQECAICSGLLLNPTKTTTLTCNHKFHTGCIKKWTANKYQAGCPICRANILYFNNNEMITYNDYNTIVSSIVNSAEKDTLEATQEYEKAIDDLHKLEADSFILSSKEISATCKNNIAIAQKIAIIRNINYIAADQRYKAIKEKANSRTFSVWELQREAETLDLENARSKTTRQQSHYTSTPAIGGGLHCLKCDAY